MSLNNLKSPARSSVSQWSVSSFPPHPPTPHHTIGSAWLPLAKFRCAGPILTISEAISGANEIKPPLDRPLPKWLLQRVEAELVIMEQRDTSPTLPSANTP